MIMTVPVLRSKLASVSKILAGIVFVSFITRVCGFTWIFAHKGLTPFTYSDSVGYLALARTIWDTHTFSTFVNGALVPEIYRTPGLPVLLAPFATGTFLPLALYPLLVSILAGILLPTLSYLIARRYVSEQAALVTAFFSGCELNLVFYSWPFLTEMPFLLLALGGLHLVLDGYEQQSRAHSVLGGMLLGLSLYMRPGFLPIYTVTILGTLLFQFIEAKTLVRSTFFVGIACFFVLSPWFLRMHSITGTFALGGVGWRNVYTDYVASIRSVEQHTNFKNEKNNLKATATQYGIPEGGYNNPANNALIRKVALTEVFAHKLTTIKLEILLLFSFFTNDNYYYLLVKYGFIPQTAGHISATYAVLSDGIHAIPALFSEMARQYFIPFIGRIISIGLIIGAVVGFFRVRNRIRYVLASVIILAAITSTVSGLGVESRFRVPIMPFIFMLASPVLVLTYESIRTKLRLII